ncbi:Sugar phosphate isomerase/epimerase [Paenibacillus sp. 1_12]|uniref:sugar phosphate isomerase/epimerase family protein n=1 Tax=Paenibacillus sp. 1_12 TaxID=1566278 RepID=UPI0008EDA5F0|nr:sugar phosphate isomerase/epimerase family protein [Paenibacillus sp. 1_12]SFM28162.1 Sugar phosphate isomerase/epimerase [Paenibacillus sp. 1_12]
MKLSVFTASTPDLTMGETISVVKEAGIDGIEWRFADVPQDALDEETSFWRNNLCSIPIASEKAKWFEYRLAAEEANITSVGVLPNMAAGDLVTTERLLRAASFMDASFIRLGVPLYNGDEPYSKLYAEAREYLRKSELLCRNYGVKGIVEIHHNTIISSASAARRLCEGFDPAFIGILYDPGNMIYEGYENFRMGLDIMGAYLAHVHVKNVSWSRVVDTDGNDIWKADWAGLRKGCVPWPQLVDDLKAIGYEGYLGLEDYSGEFATKEMLYEFAQYFRTLLS